MLIKYAAVKFTGAITSEEEFNKTVGNLSTLADDRNIKKVVKYNPDFVYARFKAIGCLEVDGPNANADGFSYGEFLDSRANYGYKSFIGKHAFVEHASDSINNSIGDLYHSYLNRFDTSKYGSKDWHDLQDEERGWILANRNAYEDGSIEVLMAVDRQLAPKIARMLETGSPTGCSMGTNIDYSECTVCGNRAYVEEQYCPHIKFSKGQNVLVPASQITDLVKKGVLKVEWLPWVLSRAEDISAVKTASRKMVYAKAFETNYGLSFFELSVVANPAFTRGYKLEKIASHKSSAQLIPIIRIAGKPAEVIFKVSDDYLAEMLGHHSEQDKILVQRSGEAAKNALATGNVHEVLVDKNSAPHFIQDDIELITAGTPGFYKLSNPAILLDKVFAKTRHRDKMGVVGGIEEDYYACASCRNMYARATDKKAAANVDKFETFSICPSCEQLGVQRTGDIYMANEKIAEYPTMPTTAEFTGDKEVKAGEGAFVGEKKDLYEGWAQKGSTQIEHEKTYRPSGTIFADPVITKNDLNNRSSRIKELTKSTEILIARTKLALHDPGTFLDEMKKSPMPSELGKPPGLIPDLGPKPMGDPFGGNPMGPMSGPPMMGEGLDIEIDMTPDSAPEILYNTKADLEFVLEDLRRAGELVNEREIEASKALKGQIRWSRRFIQAAVKTAEAVDDLISEAESAVSDALMKLERACTILDNGESTSEKETEGMAHEKKDNPFEKSEGGNPFEKSKDKDTEKKDTEKKDTEKKDNPFEKSEGGNPFAKSKGDDKPTKGDNAMAKDSRADAKLEITAENIKLIGQLRDAFASSGSNSPVQKVAEEVTEESSKQEVTTETSENSESAEVTAETKIPEGDVEKEASTVKLEKDAVAQPPTGARDPGDYADAGRIESHEMSRWWNDMYPEFLKMKSNEEINELNEPEGKVELLTGFLGTKTPDDWQVGAQTNAPDIFNVSPRTAAFVKRFIKAGPNWRQSFIGVLKVAEDGSTEAFTANFDDIAGPDGDEKEFDEFNSENYLDKVLSTVKTQGMNAAYNQMQGKVAQLEGITPGKTDTVNPLYDTREEKKDSNKARPGEWTDAKDGHGKNAGDKEYYGKAYGDKGYASDLVTANQKIAALSSDIANMKNEQRSNRLAEYALHLARLASSRGIVPFDLPNIQAQAMEYVKLDETGIQSVKAMIEKLPVVNQRALEAYQIPEAENMQKGVIHNTVDAVDRVREQHTTAENVAPEGIQPAVERDAKVSAEQQEKLRKQAQDLQNVVPQMHVAGAPINTDGLPDFTKSFNTIENQLKKAGAWEANKHLLRSNRR